MKHPLRIALCKESPYNLINILGPFHSFCKHEILIKVESTDTSNAGKTAREIKKILQSVGF